MADTKQKALDAPRRSLARQIARGLLRCCKLVLLLIALYLLIALVGLIPVNNDFTPTPDGVEIMVTSSAIHADLVLPIRNETVDWRQHLPASHFGGDVSGATHVAIGWGDRDVYTQTPTWSDLKAGTALRALFWPTASCMHVNLWDGIPTDARAVRISHEQYRRLVDHILSSFWRDERGRFMLIKGAAYGNDDAFYEAHGAYHAFNTCNGWVGRGLQTAGVRVGWFTPLPKMEFVYLPTDR